MDINTAQGNRGLENLNKIVLFFKNNSLRSSKQKNFEIFCEIIELMNQKQHLNKGGLEKIANLSSKMNRQIRSRYLESSETICQTPIVVKI